MRRIGAALLLAALALPASAILVGQADDFSALQGWQRGVLAVPGPGGLADSFLQVDADGVSANGGLVTFNQAQWSGDYLASGVKSVSMQLANLGATPLDVRLAFGDNSAPRLGGTWYATTQAVTLTPGSGWRLAVFDVGASDLVLVRGSASYAQVMSSVFTLRILHASTPQAQGESLIGSLGIDDVTARSTNGCPRCGGASIPPPGARLAAQLSRSS
jgi:hypothetical protein